MCEACHEPLELVSSEDPLVARCLRVEREAADAERRAAKDRENSVAQPKAASAAASAAVPVVIAVVMVCIALAAAVAFLTYR